MDRSAATKACASCSTAAAALSFSPVGHGHQRRDIARLSRTLRTRRRRPRPRYRRDARRYRRRSGCDRRDRPPHRPHRARRHHVSVSLGAEVVDGGTRFAVRSATPVTLCLFDDAAERQIPMTGADGVWHAEVEGVGVGTRYGYRAAPTRRNCWSIPMRSSWTGRSTTTRASASRASTRPRWSRAPSSRRPLARLSPRPSSPPAA